jgi:hypothetical protein
MALSPEESASIMASLVRRGINQGNCSLCKQGVLQPREYVAFPSRDEHRNFPVSEANMVKRLELVCVICGHCVYITP